MFTSKINECNKFVRDMNEVSSHWHFKIVKFTDKNAIVTVKGYILNTNLLEEDDKIVINNVIAISPTAEDDGFTIQLVDDNKDQVTVSTLKSTYRSGFEAAGAVAASIFIYENRKSFYSTLAGKSIAGLLGFI